MLNFYQKALLLFFITFGINTMTYATDALPTREQVQDKYKWNLSDIYPTTNDWDKEYKSIESHLPELAAHSGKITKNPNELLSFVEQMSKLEARLTKLYIYAALAQDTELDNPLFQTNYDKVQKLSSKFSAAVSFYGPELLSLSKEKFNEFISNPILKPYKFKLEFLYRMKEHTLSTEVENVLAQYSVVRSIPNDVYSILNDAELPFGKVKFEGKEVQVSHGRYRAALYNLDRNYRKDVYKETYIPYNMLKGTMAALYNGRLNTRITDARIRKYDNPIQAALYPNNIPENVYYNLIETVNKNIKTLHRWADIKKKYLKLDELHPYDTYVTLFPSVQKSYTYDEAMELMKKALAPLGDDYIKQMIHGFESRWIDVYETKNKRSGAYSNSSGSGPHPFILLNWNNTLDDVFTLAHELGHNMHSFYTEKSQPYHLC
ncbi:MAG TPA: M3 family oligoendopeptidase [Candidatus Kapabacteria bacterium]|nr:M3 family oligoendopeptidase [Candidatus Kapabacteria bacterium]